MLSSFLGVSPEPSKEIISYYFFENFLTGFVFIFSDFFYSNSFLTMKGIKFPLIFKVNFGHYEKMCLDFPQT